MNFYSVMQEKNLYYKKNKLDQFRLIFYQYHCQSFFQTTSWCIHTSISILTDQVIKNL